LLGRACRKRFIYCDCDGGTRPRAKLLLFFVSFLFNLTCIYQKGGDKVGSNSSSIANECELSKHQNKNNESGYSALKFVLL